MPRSVVLHMRFACVFLFFCVFFFVVQIVRGHLVNLDVFGEGPMNLSLNFLENLLLITSSFSAKTPENSKGPQREMNHLPTAEWGEHVSCEECNYEKTS